MRYASQGAWAFAIYNTVPVRDEVAEVLRQLLAPLPLYTFTFSPQAPNPLSYLEQIPTQLERAVVFFFDLEQTQGQTWQYLEAQRENLAARSLSLIFWVTPQARSEGVRRAPNFWSQCSGVFDFTIESPQVVAELQGAWAGQPVWLDSPADWERQMRLFSGLLREYEVEPAPPATLANLHGKVAYLLYFADRHDEATSHLQQQLTLARTAQDRAQQVDALNNLGRITQIRHGRQAAMAWYEQALVLAGDNARLRAESLRNIASVLYQESEASRALDMLRQALDLFRTVGDRLGEANTLQAIGDVQRFRDENDAALESYQAALGLFRTVGSRLGEANTLKAIGMFQLGRQEVEAGLKTLDQALQLYQRIGDRVGQANIYWSLGFHLAQNGNMKEAEPLISQAVELARQILNPDHPVLQQRETILAQVRAALKDDTK
jgi:tetratricopeptide (TPR) repeat protein